MSETGGAAERATRWWDRLVLVVSHARFVYVTVAVFVLAGIAFAFLIRWGHPIVTHLGVPAVQGNVVVPDEDKHIGSILFYMDRGWWRGPVITDFDSRYLILGELQRTPSYLYYWLMSIPASLLHLITPSFNVLVVALRLVNVVIGAVGLIVVWKTLLLARVHPAIAALALLGLSATGRYLWQSAGVSYDIPSTVLFFLFCYSCVAVIARNSSLHLVLLLLWAATVSITKYTFLPFVAVGSVAIVVIFLMRNGPGPWRALAQSVVAGVRSMPGRFITALLLLAAAAVLFCERIFGNLLLYRSIEPACDTLHTVAQCETWAIYRRNAAALEHYVKATSGGAARAQFSPFEFTGEWLDRYYKSLYFYYGRTTQYTISSVTLALVGVALAVLLIFLLVNRRPLLGSPEMRFLGILAVAYLVGTYLVNLRTYLRYDQYFAFQGRYLLPVLAIVYVVLITIVTNNWARIRRPWTYVLGIPLGILLGVLFVSHLSVVGFFEYAQRTHWFSFVARSLLPGLH